jgi:hypothetical protein
MDTISVPEPAAENLATCTARALNRDVRNRIHGSIYARIYTYTYVYIRMCAVVYRMFDPVWQWGQGYIRRIYTYVYVSVCIRRICI